MNKLAVSALLFTALIASATAAHNNSTNQAQQQVEASPGIIGPGSMFYGLELAMDQASMAVGLTTPQQVAAERASEALAMTERNNTQAAEKALKQLEDLSADHNITERNGTSRAIQILGQVRQEAPEQAMQGLNTAMNNLQKNVKARIPAGPMKGEGTPPGPPEAGQNPVIEDPVMNGTGEEGNTTAPGAVDSTDGTPTGEEIETTNDTQTGGQPQPTGRQ